MRSSLLLALACVVPACAPLSTGVGQTAMPLRPGGTEVGLTYGFEHQASTSESTDPYSGRTTPTTTTSNEFPKLEGNAAYGLTDAIGLTAHVSPAGLQPGIKVAVIRTPDFYLAFLPQIGFGIYQQQADPPSRNDVTATSMLVGAKLLASLGNGAYAAFGYDYQRLSAHQMDSVTNPVPDVTELDNLLVAAGFDAHLGHRLRLRPEVSLTRSSDETTTTWIVFPSLTLAVATD